MDGKDNKHDVRILGIKHHQDRIERAQDNKKVTVWCVMRANQAYGLCYFASPVVNGKSNKRLLTGYSLRKCTCRTFKHLFQKDGAPKNYGLEVHQFLAEKLPGWRIGRGGSITWSTRSPDLRPLKFLL